MSEIHIDIVTPTGIVFSGTAFSCTTPGVGGKFQVLNQHAAMISLLNLGEIKLGFKDGEKSMANSSGLLEVKDNKINILVETAEWADKIDVERAKAAKERAINRIENKDNIDISRAESALARAINRIKVASRT